MNRCWIKSPQGAMPLILPVAHTGSPRTLEEVKLVYQENWPLRMERSLSACYRKSAYFEYYFPDIQALLHRRHEGLWAFCLEGIEIMARASGKIPPPLRTDALPFEFSEKTFPPRPDLQEDSEKSHFQLFGPFIPGLSGLDALFHYGPDFAAHQA